MLDLRTGPKTSAARALCVWAALIVVAVVWGAALDCDAS